MRLRHLFLVNPARVLAGYLRTTPCYLKRAAAVLVVLMSGACSEAEDGAERSIDQVNGGDDSAADDAASVEDGTSDVPSFDGSNTDGAGVSDEAESATDDSTTDDGAGDDATPADDDRPADPTEPDSGGGDCAADCPVAAICQICDDGSCASPVPQCNPDGSCAGVDWVCPEQPTPQAGPDGCDAPNRDYVADSPEQCAVIDYVCPDGQDYFGDECGCGCIVDDRSSECDQPNRQYAADSPERCAVIRFACDDDERPFSDECGCGCEASVGECSEIEARLEVELRELARCDIDDDCTTQSNVLCGSGLSQSLSGCFLPLNVEADVSALEALQAEALGCVLFVADCACTEAPEVICTSGTCVAVEAETEAMLCADTGGNWEEGSCGHYDCGREPACEALIPGCDCGPLQNFTRGFGCATDPECGLD